jgi:hypothetical protein
MNELRKAAEKERPKALRLADDLEHPAGSSGVYRDKAAAELRRLHQSEKEAWRYADELEQERKRLTKAAEMALAYIEQALAQHDQQYQRHPSTERDRQVIVNDLEALRQALAQPVDAVNISQERVDETVKREHEPVAYVHLKEWLDGTLWPEDAFSQNPHEEMTPLYTAPPQKEWVGLTDEDIDLYALDIGVTANKAPAWLVTYARDIETKLKEKNGG